MCACELEDKMTLHHVMMAAGQQREVSGEAELTRSGLLPWIYAASRVVSLTHLSCVISVISAPLLRSSALTAININPSGIPLFSPPSSSSSSFAHRHGQSVWTRLDKVREGRTVSGHQSSQLLALASIHLTNSHCLLCSLSATDTWTSISTVSLFLSRSS